MNDVTREAFDVLRKHYGSLWCPTCGPSTIPTDGTSWNSAKHQVEMLAALGLLAPDKTTPSKEHTKFLCRVGFHSWPVYVDSYTQAPAPVRCTRCGKER